MVALLALLFGAPAAPALAGEMTGATLVQPVFSQIVAIPAPEGFASAYEATQGANYIHELVPGDQDVEHWSQMITLTGTANAAANGTPDDLAARFAAQIGDGYWRACPASFAGARLAPPTVSGARAVFAGWLACGTAGRPDLSEQMTFVVMIGTRDIYTLQWAARGAPSDAPPPFDRALWAERLATLASGVRICDITPGEGPPYPGCTAR
ncbi:hypothetical protein [Acidimangrovimonas sediminis]|uniref:hypothetical protein n=1 Tax=Acidimangrovimonas sediminis TaxID=2056283 RepID=UPI000C7F8995|nr:hypothetical protein [Acidimangrovimonas sediminis]